MKWILLLALLGLTGCAMLGVYQNCEVVPSGKNWVCEKSIWSK